MNNRKISALILVVMMMVTNMAGAQSFEDILNGLRGGKNNNNTENNVGGGSTLGNLIEGVFSKSDITVKDMMGVWSSNGPAVSFKSDNFLKKAGGLAASAAIEKELSKYYKQYGLNGMTMIINADATFEMKINRLLTLKGNITQVEGEKGVFKFNFLAMGTMKIGSLTTYVQKTSKSMDIMFDATKLKNLISAIAKFTGNKLATTLGTMLDSYEGLCVGFRMEKTGNVEGEQQKGTNIFNNSSDSTGNNQNGIGDAINGLFNILGGSSKK